MPVQEHRWRARWLFSTLDSGLKQEWLQGIAVCIWAKWGELVLLVGFSEASSEKTKPQFVWYLRYLHGRRSVNLSLTVQMMACMYHDLHTTNHTESPAALFPLFSENETACSREAMNKHMLLLHSLLWQIFLELALTSTVCLALPYLRKQFVENPSTWEKCLQGRASHTKYLWLEDLLFLASWLFLHHSLQFRSNIQSTVRTWLSQLCDGINYRNCITNVRKILVDWQDCL